MRVAFDIGGVLSKYPGQFRLLSRILDEAGIEVHIITDMHPKETVLEHLALNGFEFIPADHVHSADYDAYGEGCKAVLLEQLRIDLFVDDFIGYVAAGGAPIRLLVMPDATRPYYHDDWHVPGDQPLFGRRVWTKP